MAIDDGRRQGYGRRGCQRLGTDVARALAGMLQYNDPWHAAPVWGRRHHPRDIKGETSRPA